MATTTIRSRAAMARGTAQRAVGRPVIDSFVPVCDCGQALDACQGSHCSRCGVTLGKRCRSGGAR